MEDWRGKAFDFAQEVTKQIITLSTVVIALTITFVKDFAQSAPDGAKVLLAVSWVLYLLSIISGVATLMALTGSLGLGEAVPRIDGTNVRRPAIGQVTFFLLGLVLTVAAGAWAL